MSEMKSDAPFKRVEGGAITVPASGGQAQSPDGTSFIVRPALQPEQMDAALAEYMRWGTGFSSARAREISHWVGRMDDAGEWVEMSAHRGSERAEEARHAQALRAAIEAALARVEAK